MFIKSRQKFLLKILLTCICSLVIFCLENTVNAAKVHEGVPSVLLNKYWVIYNKHHKAEYFYVGKDTITLKHGKQGNIIGKYTCYSKVNGWYVLSSNDPNNSSNGIWWFVKPFNSWKNIKFGYAILPVNKVPTYAPGYYTQKSAHRVSKVTAILH